eukprot:TRINITY_DN1975_c0_g1_i1.p1 TRINITY_DN1975_c0_g1~~TRINITY_DN1975_c0_g1_i1.p1  ORF type:complete len:295 (-),score=99.59 TRINITY_DN1975_c0_g1_i1:18-902(-)
MRCCPNPKRCDNIIEYRGPGHSKDVVTCSGCQYLFCFACEREDHRPVSCPQMGLWEEKTRDPASKESMNWIVANTKPCPKCKKQIFKDEGCNHMTCRPPSGCGHEFCWLCRADWTTHGQHTGGYYSCNKYETSDAKKDDDESARVKAEIDRYLHYYNRFHNYNNDVVNCSQKKLEQAKEKMNTFLIEAQTPSKRYGQKPDFLLQAVELEIKCRKLLRYTYILAFFMDKTPKPKKDLFDFYQANVEGVTERLADLNKASLADLNDDELKSRVTVTEKYLKSMSEVLEEFAETTNK